MSFLDCLPGLSSRLCLEGFTDWHSHILPGVDDGVPTMDKALHILGIYERLGVSDVWLTPHIMTDSPNTTARLRRRFADLRNMYSGAVRLHLGAENMIDSLFESRLEADDLLPVGEDSDMLLVETSYYSPPECFMEILGKIWAKGYIPLLAHPERYRYIDSIEKYRRLHDKGVQFQLNILSLIGFYGDTAKEKSRRLLAEGIYDHVGSDLHRTSQIELIERMRLPRNLARAISS